jgi:hypothetical protein
MSMQLSGDRGEYLMAFDPFKVREVYVKSLTGHLKLGFVKGERVGLDVG